MNAPVEEDSSTRSFWASATNTFPDASTATPPGEEN
jgi:hypothetical protein